MAYDPYRAFAMTMGQDVDLLNKTLGQMTGVSPAGLFIQPGQEQGPQAAPPQQQQPQMQPPNPMQPPQPPAPPPQPGLSFGGGFGQGPSPQMPSLFPTDRDLQAGNANPFATPNPDNWDAIRAGIFDGESNGDYNALFGFSNREGGPFSHVKLTDMTVDQAIDFANPKGAYGRWVKSHNGGTTSTPMGAFQVIGSTLKDAKKGMGLKGDELMSPDMQEEIGKYIYRTQGTKAWAGYKGPGDPDKVRLSSSNYAMPGGAGPDLPDSIMQPYVPTRREKIGGVLSGLGVGLGQIAAMQPVDVGGVFDQIGARGKEAQKRQMEIYQERRRVFEREQDAAIRAQEQQQARDFEAQQNQLGRQNNLDIKTLDLANDKSFYSWKQDADLKQLTVANELADQKIADMRQRIANAGHADVAATLDGLSGVEGLQSANKVMEQLGGNAVSLTGKEIEASRQRQRFMEQAQVLANSGDPTLAKVGNAIALSGGTINPTDAFKQVSDNLKDLAGFEAFSNMDPETQQSYLAYMKGKSGGGQTINLGDTMAVTKFKAGQERINKLSQDWDEGLGNRQALDSMAALMQGADWTTPSGPTEQMLLPVRKVLVDLGMMSEEEASTISTQDAIQKLQFRMAALLRSPGAISNYEQQQQMAASPGMSTSPLGNRLTLQILQGNVAAQQDYLEQMQGYLSANGDTAGFDKFYRQRVEDGMVPRGLITSEDTLNDTRLMNLVMNGSIKPGVLWQSKDPMTGAVSFSPMTQDEYQEILDELGR